MEIRTFVDQLPHAAIRLIGARPDLFARQGAVVAAWRRRNGKTFGPYYRLTYRQDARQRSIYLGRAGPLVVEVRRRLAALQRPLRQQRLHARLRRRIRSALRLQKRRCAALLRPYGLRLKGFEVRGWRTSPLGSPIRRSCRRLSALTAIQARRKLLRSGWRAAAGALATRRGIVECGDSSPLFMSNGKGRPANRTRTDASLTSVGPCASLNRF